MKIVKKDLNPLLDVEVDRIEKLRMLVENERYEDLAIRI